MPLVTFVRGALPKAPQRVFLAIPTGSGAIRGACVASLLEAVPALERAGISVDVCIESGNCHVDDARNSLVREAMKTDFTDFVFIDDDVGFRVEDLLALLAYDRDLVAGVYPKKQEPEDYPVMAQGRLQAEADGCVEVQGAPTGFMRIRRNVLEAMLAKYSSRSFIGQNGDAIPYTLLFEREIADGRRWSGDYNFCRRWRALGGKVYVAPEMAFVHEGIKQWSGTLGAFWRKKHGVEAQYNRAKFQEAVDALKSGHVTAAHFDALVAGWNNSGWSATPDLLMTAYRAAQQAHGPILECGSGLTTLVMALATQQPIHALEQDPEWASVIESVLAHYGLEHVTLHVAPLAGNWYDTVTLPALPWAVALVDGPPRNLADRSVFYNALGDAIGNAVLIVDDTQDPAQVAPLEAWASSQGRKVHTFDQGSKAFTVSMAH